MHPFDRLAALCLWGARNLAYNLTFIPEEQLRWHPSPGAPSALGIAEHLAESLAAMRPLLEGGRWEPCPHTFATAEEAGDTLINLAERYGHALLAVPPASLKSTVIAGRRQVSVRLERAAEMAVADALHHHGQIAYLQILLGDPLSHFIPDNVQLSQE